MGFPTLQNVLKAVDDLNWKNQKDQDLRRSVGLWHVLIFLRHCKLRGLDKREFHFEQASDIAEACFDVNGILLPAERSSRQVYYEPAASQGATPNAFFRHGDGPRQTYLNRIYTGLTGGGAKQPHLFNVDNSGLPVTVSLAEDWIDTLRKNSENQYLLDQCTKAILTFSFRYGSPAVGSSTSSVATYEDETKSLKRRGNLSLKPLPASSEELAVVVQDYFGLSPAELNSLFPNLKSVDTSSWDGEEPVNFSELQKALVAKYSGSTIEAPESDLSDQDDAWKTVSELLNDGATAIMLTGSPGTSKTWYARKIAAKISNNDPACVRFVQFHPSFGYEDFMEGYVPIVRDDGHLIFRPVEKVFLQLCKLAANDATGKKYVLVIDEFSRGDPSRIFGEALTYIEVSYRNKEFVLPYSNQTVSIPSNLVIVATMNPYDKSVSDIDDAMQRRFTWVSMDPDVGILKEALSKTKIAPKLLGGILEFFNYLNGGVCPHGFGHAFFLNVKDDASLIKLWNHQLRFTFQKMFLFEPEKFAEVKDAYSKLVPDPAALK